VTLANPRAPGITGGYLQVTGSLPLIVADARRSLRHHLQVPEHMRLFCMLRVVMFDVGDALLTLKGGSIVAH
jgi:hypothetical protein